MGGSGGSSGKSDYPPYMKEIHEIWLDDLDGIFTSQITNNPYVDTWAATPGEANTPVSPYDPDIELAANTTAMAAYLTLINAIDPANNWETYFEINKGLIPDQSSLINSWTDNYTEVNELLDDDNLDDSLIEDAIEAHSDQLDNRINLEVLPAFKVGMQNVNSVMTSAFVVGEAIIRSLNANDANKFAADLRLDQERQRLTFKNQRTALIVQSVDGMTKRDMGVLDYHNRRYAAILTANQNMFSVIISTSDQMRAYTQTNLEGNRIHIIAKKEETEAAIEFESAMVRWDSEVYAPAGNMLAAISGAAVQQGSGASRGASAMGGAMSGAAAGVMVGGGLIGAAVGAVLGGVGGYLSAT